MVDQAAAACQAALDAGSLRQTVVFLLPVNEKEVDFTNTEPMDYPCSLQKVRAAGLHYQWACLPRVTQS